MFVTSFKSSANGVIDDLVCGSGLAYPTDLLHVNSVDFVFHHLGYSLHNRLNGNVRIKGLRGTPIKGLFVELNSDFLFFNESAVIKLVEKSGETDNRSSCYGSFAGGSPSAVRDERCDLLEAEDGFLRQPGVMINQWGVDLTKRVL